MFFCHFWWETNEAKFEVFNWDISADCPNNDCLWQVWDWAITLRTSYITTRWIRKWNDDNGDDDYY